MLMVHGLASGVLVWLRVELGFAVLRAEAVGPVVILGCDAGNGDGALADRIDVGREAGGGERSRRGSGAPVLPRDVFTRVALVRHSRHGSPPRASVLRLRCVLTCSEMPGPCGPRARRESS